MRERISLGLVHYPTLDREGRVVAAAVTTLDLHDLARLARTYGLGRVYATTPLAAQKALVRRLLDHWIRGRGGRVNPSRREAIEAVCVVDSLGEAVRDLRARWEQSPEVVATSARGSGDRVGFFEARSRIQSLAGPILLVFGTGWGLAPEVLDSCHWTLEPVRGVGSYNHLSVRSAASIVVDRLFGDR